MKTRYPILLVHGLGVRDIFFLKSFGYIDRLLRIQGYEVRKSAIDGFGSIETNAEQLRTEVLSICQECAADKVNLIAHSKGGLDARYMLEHLDSAQHVASLTTLCTPHRGTPVASFLLRFPLWMLKYVAFFINLFYRVMGDKHPDALTACRQLKRVNTEEANPLPSIPGVYCQSFSATMRKGSRRKDFISVIPTVFSHLIDKHHATDGLVPQDSAVFGHFRGDCIDDSVSHTDIIDFAVPNKRKDKIYAFYSTLCEELVNMGY